MSFGAGNGEKQTLIDCYKRKTIEHTDTEMKKQARNDTGKTKKFNLKTKLLEINSVGILDHSHQLFWHNLLFTIKNISQKL